MKNDDKTAITSYSDRCLDDGTMLIAHDLEILVLVVEQGIRLADLDGRVRVGFAAQLLEELVDVIVVDVAVAASENAATSPPITETACNPDGSHGTPKPSRSQRNATSAAARVTASAIAPTVSRRPNPMNHINPRMVSFSIFPYGVGVRIGWAPALRPAPTPRLTGRMRGTSHTRRGLAARRTGIRNPSSIRADASPTR